MIIFPNAKINIGLNIVNKRGDGYHDLETVFYPVMVKDVLEIIESDKLSFTTSGVAVPGLSENNICLKAYELLSRDIKLPALKIHLHKNIPIGAGLGGGSADASFFIKLLNQKFDLDFSTQQMEYYASQLGADCAFFIRNQPVFASGRGDIFESVGVDLSTYFLVLVMPDVHVATADAFRHIKPERPVASLKSLITSDIREWKESIKNDFEPGIISMHPEIGVIKDSLYHSGAIYASMSGSGSAVYGVFEFPVNLPEMEVYHRVFYGI